MSKTLVFVYGTLLAGEPNNFFLKGSTKLGEDSVTGFLMKDLGPFPACVPNDNENNTIVGEVWEVSDETFKHLDRLEGYPDFYDRVLVDTFAGKAWIYVNAGASSSPTIKSGDWKKYLIERDD